MNAMLLHHTVSLADNPEPLRLEVLPDPKPGPGQIRIRVSACGVCHTELDEIEGRTPPPVFPIVLGHEVVGKVDALGDGVETYQIGDRLGVGWIFSSCGLCPFCKAGLENLCPDFQATGRDAFGGYAEHMVIGEDFAFPIPDIFKDTEAAPLLCAGAIGFRSLRLTGLEDGQILGLTGFGGSAHLVLKMVRHQYPQSQVFVFARNEKERDFARSLGAAWAGDTTDTSPKPCRAIIDTTPVWKPVVEALRNLEPGGRLVINAIRKEDVDKSYFMNLDYARHVWMEKEIKSVANVARLDIAGFLKLAADIPVRPEIQTYPLDQANQALTDLKAGHIRGAKVLVMD